MEDTRDGGFLHIPDMTSGLLVKFHVLNLSDKYGITVYLLDFTHPQLALVRILANQKAVRLL